MKLAVQQILPISTLTIDCWFERILYTWVDRTLTMIGPVADDNLVFVPPSMSLNFPKSWAIYQNLPIPRDGSAEFLLRMS
jgi:hypothetical protein